MNLNKTIFGDKWEEIRAHSITWWSLFTEEDLKKVEKAPVMLDKYAMMLRVKYGYSHERAREEINKRIAELDANPPARQSVEAAPPRPDDVPVSPVRAHRTKKPRSLASSE